MNVIALENSESIAFQDYDITDLNHILNPHFIYRLILASVLLTSKFYNDVFYGNHFVAYIGGIHTQEMNLLEQKFLEFLDWRLWVEPSTEYE